MIVFFHSKPVILTLNAHPVHEIHNSPVILTAVNGEVDISTIAVGLYRESYPFELRAMN